MRRGWFVVLGVVIACRGGESEPRGGGAEEPRYVALEDDGPELALDQPPVGDGVRTIWEMDRGALAPDARGPALERAAVVIRRRLAKSRVVGHVVVEDDKLVVDLAGTDPEALWHTRERIARTGKLEVHAVVAGTGYMLGVLHALAAKPVEGVTTGLDRWVSGSGKRGTDAFLLAADRLELVDAAEAQRIGCLRPSAGHRIDCLVTGRRAIERALASIGAGSSRVTLADRLEVAFERLRLDADRPQRFARWRSYVIERDAALTGAAVLHATARQVLGDAEHVEVVAELDAIGAQTLAAVTAARGGDKLAILVDDRVLSATVIDEAVRSGRLSLPVGAIGPTDDDSLREAKDLAIILSAGALPAPIRLNAEARLVGGVVQVDPDQ